MVKTTWAAVVERWPVELVVEVVQVAMGNEQVSMTSRWYSALGSEAVGCAVGGVRQERSRRLAMEDEWPKAVDKGHCSMRSN